MAVPVFGCYVPYGRVAKPNVFRTVIVLLFFSFYFAPVGVYTSSDPIQFIGPLTTGAKVSSLSSKVALSTVSQLLGSGQANARPVLERPWIIENLVFSVTIGSRRLLSTSWFQPIFS